MATTLYNHCGKRHLGPAVKVDVHVQCLCCGKALTVEEQIEYARTWVTVQNMMIASCNEGNKRAGKGKVGEK